MTKYSEQFKLALVREYQEGKLGYYLLAKKHGIKSSTAIKNWVKVYEKYGMEGLMLKKHNDVYSVQFKLDVLDYMKNTGASVMNTALKFGLTNPPLITTWKKVYLEGGLEALDKPKGWPSMSDKPKNRKNKKTTEEKELTYEQNYGYRRIQLELKNRGFKVNHKKVQRLMRKRGLKGDKFRLKSRKYSSYKGTTGTVAKNLINRRFHTNVCHQKLATDITEFKCSDGLKLYLNPIMDMFNGEILSFGIGMRPTLELALTPLEEALEIVIDSKFRTTIHTDQGWHYQHNKWVKTLKENKVFQSMSRKGNCLDNSPMENFFGLMKQEMYYGEPLYSYEELEKRIEEYIHYYNYKRIKQKLAGMSPVQYRVHTSQIAA
ncbi:IS3 family transposase [Bacillus sp. Y1]|nr:IS3 family transposase [Bacillus sp. Y1]AYA74671.1 IS3 family transposase [Bacillus sp. Y1]